MITEDEKDESRPKKVIPSVRKENTEQEQGSGAEQRPYNSQQGAYERPEGNYERRPSDNRPQGGYQGNNYHRQGGYQPRGGYQGGYQGNNYRQGGYQGGNNYRQGGGYQGNNYRQGGYQGNNYRQGGYQGNNYRQGGYQPRQGGYGNQGEGGYERPYRPQNRPPYEGGPAKVYSTTPSSEGMPGEGMKKRRPRVGESRPDMRQGGYMPRGGGRPYGNRQGGYQGGGGYNNGGYRPQQRRPQGNYNPNAKYGLQKQLKYKEVLADPNEPIRLNKFLSNAGVCSRREADQFIQAGNVKVNGEVITTLGTKITRQDEVLFNDRQVHIESKVYIVLNKPKNCVTTSEDPQERRTVMDLVKGACHERIYPVGRLDRNTTGVLLLTNDGDLASKLTHPAYKKKKIYHVWLDKEVAIEDMEKIANGIELEDGEIHADAISYASEDDKTQVGIEVHSGRNRIVRRIFESLGYHVVKLDRVYFAGLTKKNLARGKWRYLNEKEVNALRMGSFE